MVYLPPFDPARALVAQKVFRFNGIIYRRGDSFPAEGATDPGERKLKRLYETHHVRYADEEQEQASMAGLSPAERSRMENLDRDKSGKPGGSLPRNDETISDEAKKMAAKKGNTHEVLFQRASGIAGVTKDQTKAQIAQALINAGRGDGAA